MKVVRDRASIKVCPGAHHSFDSDREGEASFALHLE